jgi:hypothetical protein
MGYGLIFPIATAVLSLRYIISSDASHRAKYIVGGLAWASFLVPQNIPYCGILIQFGVCVFVLFYLKSVNPHR